MRKIGQLPEQDQAVRLCDYLLTKGISAMAEPAGGDDPSWSVWIRDEDQLSEARGYLSDFATAPDDERFRVEKQAEEIRKQVGEQNKQRLSLQRSVQGASWSTSGRYLHEKPRLTLAFIVVCVIVFFVTDPQTANRRINAAESNNSSLDFGMRLFFAFKFVDPVDYYESTNNGQLEGDALASVKKGELWRAFTPNLLHGSIMHLAFNMMALYFLGGAIERLQSPLVLGTLLLLTGVTAIVLQCVVPEPFGGPNVVGISGAIYGLFGYLWVRPIIQPSFPNLLPKSTVILLLAFMVMFIILPSGATGMAVANVAHVAGLFAGILCAAVAARLNT